MEQPIHGTAVITVRFENRVQWQKYRKYILKTDWEFDSGYHPYTATLELPFKSAQDVDYIAMRVVQLLQFGFDVYSCSWKLDRNDILKAERVDSNGMVHHEEIPLTKLDIATINVN